MAGLKKELNLLSVFAIATGTTLSAGFFLLPGLAAAQAGPALIIAYLIAAIPMIPAMFSVIELATAMPKAGGMYYFMDRTLGPIFGTIGGIGTWLALVLKVSFALVGMGAYITLFFPEVQGIFLGVILALLLGILNIYGAEKTGKLQIYLVAGLLIILIGFISGGIPELRSVNFNGFFDSGVDSILATAGLVYISYVGITKVASLSEEVINPERNLPLGVILSLSVSILIYILGTTVMVGVLPMDKLAGNLTPVSAAAEVFLGKTGSVIVAIAALFAFVSVANAGTMSASRYPLAMSRDNIMPGFFKKLGKHGTPINAIIVTVLVIILILIFLNPLKIAKLASAFQLLMFSLACLGVIIMRESKIDSYDPGYFSPFYPWMQILGIISPFYLIFQMGLLPSLFTVGLIVTGSVWYFLYAKDKVVRQGAIYHVFARLGQQRYGGLDTELRGILKEKGFRKGDPFEEVVMNSTILDLKESLPFEVVVKIAADKMQQLIPLSADKIEEKVLEGTRLGATPVTHGFALPHFTASKIEISEMILIRCLNGVNIKVYDPITHEIEEEQIVKAIFFLVSPEENPTMHLRILAQIAGRVDEEQFTEEWEAAKDELELKEALLHNERFFSLCLNKKSKSKSLIGKSINEINISGECLIALIRREGNIVVPKGHTVLKENDRLTIIGEPKCMIKLKELYGGGSNKKANNKLSEN